MNDTLLIILAVGAVALLIANENSSVVSTPSQIPMPAPSSVTASHYPPCPPGTTFVQSGLIPTCQFPQVGSAAPAGYVLVGSTWVSAR